jgi:tripartite-type tricarboxylate transporter receptor subunit TctC
MNRLLVALFACAASIASPILHAGDNYPSKPIRVIVPFTAGGIGDTVARIVSVPLSAELGSPVIVENRPGGDGLIGTEYAARAEPDGYTILQVSTPMSINTVLRANVRYNLLRDFTPIGCAVRSTLVLVVPATSPNRTVADLVANAKSKPGGLSFGSGAIGSVGHLSGELFKRDANISAVHIPYQGNSAVLPDLIGGRIDFFFASQPEAVQGVAAGQLRALAVTAAQRIPTFPNVPTMIEAGYPGFDPSSNYGYMLPANAPAPIVEKLHDALAKVLASPAVQAHFKSLGLVPNTCTPDEWDATLKTEISRWGQVVKTAHVHVE